MNDIACAAPHCQHGARRWPCPRCHGSGCSRCDDGTRWAVCAECDGTGTVTRALWELQRHYETLVTLPPCDTETRPGSVDVRPGGPVLARHDQRWWQADEHPSAAALAYLALRPVLRGPEAIVEVAVVAHPYLGDDHGAGVIVARGACELVLTSVTWGYRGRGPQTLAAIIADVSVVRSFELALDWVEMQPEWRLDWALRVPAPTAG